MIEPVPIGLASLYGTSLENLEKKDRSLIIGLGKYLTDFYNRLHLTTLIKRDRGVLRENVFQNALGFIANNNKVARIYASPEFDTIVKKEKESRGPCSIGISICIDGRVVIPFIAGRLVKAHEAKAGIIEEAPSPIDGINEISSGRLAEAIKKRASEGDLLEILFAHTSLHHPDHGCGAMTQMKEKHDFPEEVELVRENLKIQQKKAQLIKKLFNKERMRLHEPELARLAISAVYDTDSMGVILDWNKKKNYSTTKLTERIVDSLHKYLSTLKDSASIKPGVLADFYTNPNWAYTLEGLIAEIIPEILKFPAFADPTNTFIEKSYSDLNNKQKQALLFFLARTVAFQYLTGSYKADPHLHAYHAEDFQSISQDGPNIGQFMTDAQVFGAGPLSPQTAVEHILTQTSLMEQHSKGQKPYVLFIVKSVSAAVEPDSMERIRGINRDYFMAILSDPKIQQLIKDGVLAPIPAIINEKTREVIKIPNFAI